MAIAESLILEVQAKVGSAVRDLNQVNQSTSRLVRMGDKLKKLGAGLTRFGRQYSMFVTAPIIAAGVASLKFAADLEKQSIAFEVMLGSASKATKLFDEIKDFSATTPFQLPELVEGTKKLLAFGTASEDVVETMRSLGNVAMGDSAKLGSLVDAFGKVQARGKASMRELNMFLYAGVPIIDELAKGLGATTEEIFSISF